MDNTNLIFNFKNPVVASDGHTVAIDDKGHVSLLFFQIREQTPQGINADVVAGVRLHSIDELKELQKLITETIKKHETREP